MEPEGSLPCSQEPSTGPYPDSDQSSLYHLVFTTPSHLRPFFNIILPPTMFRSS
jgi:hypothetical protein